MFKKVDLPLSNHLVIFFPYRPEQGRLDVRLQLISLGPLCNRSLDFFENLLHFVALLEQLRHYINGLQALYIHILNIFDFILTGSLRELMQM